MDNVLIYILIENNRCKQFGTESCAYGGDTSAEKLTAADQILVRADTQLSWICPMIGGAQIVAQTPCFKPIPTYNALFPFCF